MKELLLQNAVIGYGSNIILENVNLELKGGEACALLGPNGSGKTSLIRCLLGLQKLKAGIRSSGFHSYGYVPQMRSLDRQFPITIKRCLEMSFPGFGYLIGQKRLKMSEKVDKALELVGIKHKSSQLLRECSGGELQRALIARALVHFPELLVLDEPTNSLDVSGKREILELLESLYKKNRITILLTTHESNLDIMKMFTSKIKIEEKTLLKEKWRADDNV